MISRTLRAAVVVSVSLFVMMASNALYPAVLPYAYAAEASDDALLSLYNKDLVYDVYYEVNAYEVNRVDNVRIIDTVTVAGVTFLRVRYNGVADREAYITLAHVRAIIPSQASKPFRSTYAGRQN